MTDLTAAIVRFCAEEVARQGRGPIEVAGMVDAWQDALRHWAEGRRRLTALKVQRWGHLIEPTVNPDRRWRSVGVRVGWRVCPTPSEVPHLMASYLLAAPRMTPVEAYGEFERVHPFGDGNGRVGKIIFNWSAGTLDAPTMPPDLFGGISNP